ncbi:ATP-binding protein [Chitinophaga sp. 22620]|uniref:ATP-binding protein n=1 Tax=Chitinophaga sp. 22620 TaxID=3453952 RepID=UPI003F825CB6
MLKPSNITPPHAAANGLQDPYLVTGLEYLRAFTYARLASHFRGEAMTVAEAPQPPKTDDTSFAKFVRHAQPAPEELLLLLSALAPFVVTGFFDNLIQQFLPQGGEFPEFGGAKGASHRGTLATGETVLFLLAGTDAAARLRMLPLFGEESYFFKHKILSIETVRPGEPSLSGRLIADPEYSEVFTTGRIGLPRLSMHFPAEHISTMMDWDDLVLPEGVWRQIRELESWIKHHDTLMQDWGMKRKLKPGYRVLFYGPPGTGKTLTATLLGKYTGREVFRIDLSMVISKYIGETEKNLASLFDKAEHKNWILFFDEADAIFGKRTGVRDAHDKYANQEVSYLLQRIEMHSGLTILASNFKNNMDDAFIRRFSSIVYFPPPRPEERLQLLQKAFPGEVKLQKDVDLPAIAAAHELTGSHIMNMVQYVCLTALERGNLALSHQDILSGVRRELEKEGK